MMLTKKQWDGSGKNFSIFVTGRSDAAWVEAYEETYYKKLYEMRGGPVEIDEDLYMYFLEVLPPYYIPGGFQCPEAVNAGTYDTFTEGGGKYYYHGHGPGGGKWVKI